ncbi:site-specific DNA-methyltransferase [Nodularia spumigena CS-584]|jgi:adenine-specific DNA-methyltransferase|uniref:Site-specific DNA-methyltransferase n=1 Tax=Nodularia spumigena UHCC 0060 TaxID=3110300 RepID=A0ABU5UMR2_NODSP|nr:MULTISPECIES: site-specific DNA-methyltransferase [Cyanophyceae]MDB9356129.1 site-specific DNA-methyltransferase [Nodularia spumigena CS-587/03]AHJ27061.1 Type III restriction-modification system methylation subunit [Nodularia spumigena CCY9414]EAW47370.1 putative type II DNA modification enzyme (methyltransferase) [Nodularia spumigena CCY9414]MDB9341194.1 site-specific DNA-methyltransferase [Nodularia spumigena CS-589/07]MDB9344327.1 site-specific DNA-methyltransferase [Nodularia spumigena
MATGITKKNGHKSKKQNTISFRLEYEGKIPVEEILKTQPARLRRIISVDKKPINQLIYGENLRVLSSLIKNDAVVGKVGLIYIDPPYATGSSFESRKRDHAYHDIMEGAEYLEFLRQRLILLRELLSEEGSIYVHLDQNMACAVKIIMDEIFGTKNFRNWITRKKCNPKNYTRNQYGNIADYILFYTKTENYVWNQQFDPWTENTAKKEYQYVEERTGRIYKKVPIHAPGVRKGATGQPWRGMLPPPGKHWQYTPQTLDEMDTRGEIYWSSTGNPRRKVYLDNSQGISVQDIWLNFKDAHNQNIKITGYPTEKNLDFIKRIILASSNPGDLVLDAFAGSGTTVAVAEELGRKWIAIDNSSLAITTIVQRLVKGTEAMGDFVNRNNPTKYEQQSLINTNRILHTGLDLYFEETPELELISDTAIKNWNSQLNCQANLL